jgi:hypothetical protein
MTVMCSGTLTTLVPSGVPACLDAAGNAVAWANSVPFDFTQLDGPTLAAVFGIGFTIMGMSWFIGRAVGMVLRAVKNL